MLNRRHLRVKVLQSLYAFFQSGNKDLEKGEKELLFGIEKIYDLYLYQLQVLSELLHIAELKIEEKRNKRLPDPEDLNPNTRFIENPIFKIVRNSEELKKFVKDKKISWANDIDLIRKLYRKIQECRYYRRYLDKESSTFTEDRDFVINILIDEVCNFELIHSFYEESSIYWLDDWEMVNKMIVKNLKMLEGTKDEQFKLMPLFKDSEDKAFAKELYKITILSTDELGPLISKRTQNWDIERIALMDILIMKMALTEILKFPGIPVKVTLNEYIEISKMYSTPKSKIFVNGVLDKIVEEFYASNKINKLTK